MTTVGVRPAPEIRRPTDIKALSARLADEVAAPAAAEVDRLGRFPSETIEALSEAGLLSALVPRALGGWGASLTQAGDGVFALARRCASSAMVLAMHHLQVACLVRHAATETFESYLRELADLQWLLASATTEINIGGQLRTSSCAVEEVPGGFRLEKVAPVISYGAYADAILVTARRDPDSPPSDQVLVLCPSATTTLEEKAPWNALGLRGTCSSGFQLSATGTKDHVLPVPFAEIAERTMLPVSHILWGYVWLGIAADAVLKARRYVQAGARKNPGTTPPGALRLSELLVIYRQMESLVKDAAHRFDETPLSDPQGISASVSANALKVGASSAVVDIVTRAMAICGINGYREDSEYSLGRHLRDAHGAVVQVNNDRILTDNAHLLLVDKEEI